ncbi:M61 family metallopeptidase [Brevundimonas sp.]|uniref:M61 family metallopeptidase n=1 Tax=Brevundimonas sp. TaxID=1871086 RepID=UPI003564B192
MMRSPARLFVSACATALLFAAVPALAQTPVLTQPQDAALALPRPQPTIPAPTRATFPGVIRYEADVTDRARRIISVRQTIPVPAAGAFTLLYPEFLPGNHAGTGPIQLISGLTVTAPDGRRLEWLRDTIEPHAFHLDIPLGVTEIEVAFQWLTQPDGGAWRVVQTPNIVNMQWEKAILYPAGYAATGITVEASIRLPEGWGYGVALDTVSNEGGLARFAPVSLYTLVDSPMFAGAHYRRFALDADGPSPVHLSLVADEAGQLQPAEGLMEKFESLVVQADRLFGARPFDRYEFLVGVTSQLGGIGLEHHRSSENTLAPDFFTRGTGSLSSRQLLPHEYVHSWNGKYMRPADELTANYNVPTQNTLLWVYEGLTSYWGEVLAARAGLAGKDETLAGLAGHAAFYETQPGRQWRSLQDTNNHNLLGYRVPGQWPSWMRTTTDYYDEALLVWLDADTLIREGSNGRRSLDDFASGFFGRLDGEAQARGYTFEEVVAALDAVHPHDWSGFLRSRLDAVGPDARAPLDGLARGGYRLTWVDGLTATEKQVHTGWANDFQYSLGFTLGANNRIGGVRWGGPAYEAGLGAGWDLIAVNDRAASAEVLRQAVTAAKGGSDPIVLILKNGDRFRTLSFAWHDGLRYPRLERIEGTPDRLGDILAPRRR